jgi:hypothetical protein
VNNLSLSSKKWLVSLHILFASIWFGATVTFFILCLNVLVTKDATTIESYYTSLLQLETTAGRASIIGTVITGILLSVLTHWGLFKFRWIITKEILTLLSLVLGFVFIYMWTVSGNDMNKLSAAFKSNHLQLLIGIGVQILSLGAMYVISVFKPWGKRTQIR